MTWRQLLRSTLNFEVLSRGADAMAILVDSITSLKENGACMKASLHRPNTASRRISVTNSVTNRLGNPGQSRATVTNFVTKLRAIQGNEITTVGESRAMEGN
jgi:hypothetical protein